MKKSRTAASPVTVALRKSPVFRITATTLSVMLTTSLLMGNAPSAAASENPNTTDTTLITGSPPGNDTLEVTDSADTAEPAPEAEQAPEPTPQPEPEPAPNPAPEPAPAPETGAEIEDNSAPAQEDMTLSTTDTGTTTDTTADDSGNSEPGTTEIETPAEGTLGTYLEVFTDEGLRTAVMAKAGAQDEDEILTQETAETITNLDASGKGITDLEGIQHLTELTNLSLDNNQIADITPLEKLTNLTYLYLNNNQIKDITPIEGLTKLTSLSATGQTIEHAGTTIDSGTQLRIPLPTTPDPDKLVITNYNPQEGATREDNEAIWENVTQTATHSYQFTTTLTAGTYSGTTSMDVTVTEPEDPGPEPGTRLGTYKELFPDDGLRAAVLEAVGGDVTEDDPFTEEEAGEITSLDASSKEISDLTGIKYLTELTGLRLDRNKITDATSLTELTELPKLTALSLVHNTLTTTSSLAEITQLTQLSVNYNRLTDIESLSNLTNLTNLSLYGNSISSIDSLGDLTALTYLNLGSNDVTTVDPLARLTELTNLNLQYNQIPDVTVLSDLGKATIDASEQSITYGDAIASTSGPVTMQMPSSPTEITTSNFSPSGGEQRGGEIVWDGDAQIGLYEFDFTSQLSRNGLFSGTVSQNVTVLSLGIIETLFPDPSLAAAIAEYGDSDKAVTDHFMEEDAAEITVLGILEEGVSNLEGMQLLTNLETLSLPGNNITDITPLSGLGKLSYIDLEANDITDISALSNLGDLVTLYLDSNHIDDLSALSVLNNLGTVSATNQEITRPVHALPSGATHTMELARGIDKELVETTVVEPTHGTASNGVATWENVTLAGNHIISFDSNGEAVQGFAANRVATRAPEVAYSGAITQAVEILAAPSPEDPDPTTPEEEDGSGGSNGTGDSTGTGTGSGSGGSNANSGTGGIMSATSLPAALSRTGTDTTGLIIITLLCTLVGAGALLMLRKGRRHLHRIQTSL